MKKTMKKILVTAMALMMILECGVIAFAASASIELNTKKDKIGKNEVTLNATIKNPNGGKITKIGVEVNDAESGDQIFRHVEEMNKNYSTAKSVPMWFTTGVELPDELEEGTKYTYTMFAYIDGKEYKKKDAFTTKGNKPVVENKKNDDDDVSANVVLNSNKNKIGETSATLYGTVENPKGGKITEVGIVIYNAKNGKVMTDHDETVDKKNQTSKSLPIWFATGKELKDNLAPGTRYNYEMFAIVNGEKFEAEGGFVTREKEKVNAEILLDKSKNKIKDTSATLCATVKNPDGCKISEIGIEVYNANNKKLMSEYSKYINKTDKSLSISFRTGEELKNNLAANTKYNYEIFAIVDGERFENEGSFTTDKKDVNAQPEKTKTVIELNKSKDKISGTYALLNGNVKNPAKEKITHVGISIWDAKTGKQIENHEETVSTGNMTLTNLPIWFSTDNEIKAFLEYSNKYTYEIFAKVNGQKVSVKGEFTTGKAPVLSKPIISKDKIIDCWFPQNSNGGMNSGTWTNISNNSRLEKLMLVNGRSFKSLLTEGCQLVARAHVLRRLGATSQVIDLRKNNGQTIVSVLADPYTVALHNVDCDGSYTYNAQKGEYNLVKNGSVFTPNIFRREDAPLYNYKCSDFKVNGKTVYSKYNSLSGLSEKRKIETLAAALKVHPEGIVIAIPDSKYPHNLVLIEDRGSSFSGMERFICLDSWINNKSEGYKVPLSQSGYMKNMKKTINSITSYSCFFTVSDNTKDTYNKTKENHCCNYN